MKTPPLHSPLGGSRRGGRRNVLLCQRRPRRTILWLVAALLCLYLYGQVLDRSQDVFQPQELDVVGERAIPVWQRYESQFMAFCRCPCLPKKTLGPS